MFFRDGEIEATGILSSQQAGRSTKNITALLPLEKSSFLKRRVESTARIVSVPERISHSVPLHEVGAQENALVLEVNRSNGVAGWTYFGNEVGLETLTIHLGESPHDLRP